MPGRANELIATPGSFWQRAEVSAALSDRNIGRLFRLLRQYAAASQTQIGMACGMTQGKVSDIVRGIQQVESLAVFERIADGLQMPDGARLALGLAPQESSRLADPRSVDLRDEREGDDPVRRRTFVRLTGASLLGAVFAEPADGQTSVDVELLAPVLTTHVSGAVPAPLDAPPDLATLMAAANNARRQYQACRYSTLARFLPGLLTELHAACLALDGQAKFQAYALSADAHHVAAGLLLKLDDQGLAYLAADRSMRAAQTSQQPVMVAASARSIAHTLMDGGHLPAAIDTTRHHAAQLDRDISSHTPDSLSVYGSLLLRGALAAAQHGNRATAYELLTEAECAGRRLGMDGNLRWTAFGPTNAKMHRVNIATTLGDAGTAVDVARSIDLTKIAVTERKASLLIDTARAFLQWSKHEKAYLALRAAEQAAPEEVAGRPAVRRLVRELVSVAPPTVKREAGQFAARLGVAQ
jgi:transcriptional regulator with XRE-family HTH domain